MKRRTKRKANEEGFGTDSFLDVVSNIVGILIILVMVVGVRAKDVLVADLKPDTALNEAEEELVAARKKALSMTNDALRLASQVDQLRATRLNRTHERDQLATLTAQMNKEIASRRQELDTEAQQHLELQQALSTAIDEQQRLKSQIARAESVTEQTIEIETYATSIGQSVDGTEIHFQLKNGRVTFIPFNELIAAVKDVWQDHLWKLRSQDSVTEIEGPIKGFRARYKIVRGQASLEAQLAGAPGGSFYQVDQWQLLPNSEELGEEFERALQADSNFHATLRDYKPRRTTITLWTYPEAFGDYQKLKQHLHELGYPTAGRPMDAGQLIGASPRGTKSSAQ